MWLFDEFWYFKKLHIKQIIDSFLVIIVFLFVCLICTLMFFFFNFHRRILSENKTTIENLENKGKPYISRYDIEPKHNVEQVMGTKRWLWPFPIMPNTTKPRGEGIYFEKNVDSDVSEGEDEDSREDEQQQADNASNNIQRNDKYGGNSQGPTSQGNTNQRVNRPGNAADQQTLNENSNNQLTKQGDKMTIHNENTNKWDNLNNIVKSDNHNPVYKSSESEGNGPPVNRNTKKQYTNQINNQNYDDRK